MVQEISFHIVTFFLIFGTLRLFMMTTNLFAFANGKQLRTGGRFRILLPFFRNILGCWRPKFSNFNCFHNRVKFGTILLGLRNFFFGGGMFEPPQPFPRYATGRIYLIGSSRLRYSETRHLVCYSHKMAVLMESTEEKYVDAFATNRREEEMTS